jgi:UDP-N-acetylglucosamine 2-epimerase (non-hydrolysing)
MKKIKIILFYGTRPEFIKLYPIIKILRSNQKFEITVVNTGQHKEMVLDLENFFECKADLYLDLMTPNQNLNELLSKILLACVGLFSELSPESIIVQGDTTTVFGAATAAFYQGIKVYHVEAGLRSMDMHSPFPEEFNRRSVSLIATIHFAPTQLASNNLIAEGINKNSIVITGNTVIDTLKEVKKKLIGNTNQSDSHQIFITAHRRENHKEGIESICRAILKLLEVRNDIVFKWAVHPNPNVKDIVFRFLGEKDRVILTEPLNYLELLQELNDSYMIWTDSGGIQEEVPEFNKPILILREETERPEIIDCGLGILVGVNESKIIHETTKLLEDKVLYNSKKSIKNPFGEGNASIRILEKLIEVR